VVTAANFALSLPLGKQTHPLINALLLADQFGWLLKTEVKAFVWWQMRSTPATDGNMSEDLYGWRNTGGYGVISQENTGAIKYPTFFVYKLLKQFTEPGDSVVSCESDHPIIGAFAVINPSGGVSVLLINKHSTESIAVNFNQGRYNTGYKYGVYEDDELKNSTGTGDITALNVYSQLTIPPFTALTVKGFFQSSGLFILY